MIKKGPNSSSATHAISTLAPLKHEMTHHAVRDSGLKMKKISAIIRNCRISVKGAIKLHRTPLAQMPSEVMHN